MPDEVELISAARMLPAEDGHVILHFRTVGGTDHYIGATLDNVRQLVRQWDADVARLEHSTVKQMSN